MTLLSRVACPNCGKKVGEALFGIYYNQCPRCKQWMMIDSFASVPIIKTGLTAVEVGLELDTDRTGV